MKMKENETMDEYFGRFIEKVNQMKSFGEEVPNKKIVEKILGHQLYVSHMAQVEAASVPSTCAPSPPTWADRPRRLWNLSEVNRKQLR